MPSAANGHHGDPFRERRATREEHLEASASLRNVASTSLREGDLVTVFESYWGVVAHMLQAIAERHNLSHRTNRDFDKIIGWLVEETDDYSLQFLHSCAYTLHRNFYRIVLDEQEIRDYARYAMDLVDRIREFADS